MEIRIYNPVTGEITTEQVPDAIISVDDLKSQMTSSLNGLYQNILSRGFISSATGTSIQYKYDQNYQLIYSKWANLLALDSTKDLVLFQTYSGVVTMTRVQFIQFMNDAHDYEVNLFNNKTNLENQIASATTVDELNNIIITL